MGRNVCTVLCMALFIGLILLCQSGIPLPWMSNSEQPTSSPTEYPTKNPTTSATKAKCADIKWVGSVWSYEATGFDMSHYTNDTLKLLICMDTQKNACANATIFCNQNDNSISFGTNSASGFLRALLGPGEIPSTRSFSGTCSESKPQGICNAPDDQISATALCQQLGYETGEVGTITGVGHVPEVHWDGNTSKWTSDWMNDHGCGQNFTCY